jgi:hypothetical protein
MIVGGYSLDLYCDIVEPMNGEVTDALGHRFDEFPHAFFAETGATARADARRKGWRLDRGQGLAMCPRCTKAGRKLPADT